MEYRSNCYHKGTIIRALMYVLIKGQYPLNTSHYRKGVSRTYIIYENLRLHGNDADPVISSEGGIAELLYGIFSAGNGAQARKVCGL